MNELPLIISFVDFHHILAYVFLFFSMIIEGETILIIYGVLSHLSALSFWLSFVIAFIGVMIGDVFWYYLGVYLKYKFEDKERAKKIFNYLESNTLKLLPNFKERPFRTLFLAKYIYGTNHSTLILSGAMKMDFKTFIRAELVASFVWVVVFLTLGYFFGYAAVTFSKKIALFGLAVVVLVVAFIAIQRGLVYFYKRRKEESGDNK